MFWSKKQRPRFQFERGDLMLLDVGTREEMLALVLDIFRTEEELHRAYDWPGLRLEPWPDVDPFTYVDARRCSASHFIRLHVGMQPQRVRVVARLEDAE